MLTLPRFFGLIVHLDGVAVPAAAEAFQPVAIREAGSLGAECAVRGGGLDSNCLIPRPPVMAAMEVTLPGGRKGTFTPRIGDGNGGLLGILAAD